jgi:perosamine synthetase
LIPVFKPKLFLKDYFYVLRSLIKNDISGTSNIVQKFEKELASACNRKYAVAVSNGSVALDLALQSLDLNEEDEVIIPSFTIISCLAAVVRSKAKPIFCDVNELTWNMDIKNIEKKITSKTKAIVMVHTYGLVADGPNIESFCKERNITLIEDAAEAHGITIGNRPTGSFGLMSTFSFYANKHITSGEGGVILTDDEEIYNLLQQMRNLDFTPENRFNHKNFYWNYRLSGIQASLGLSQLNSISKTIRFKKKQGENYQEMFKDKIEILQLPLKEHLGIENNYWVFGIVIKKDGLRDKLADYLNINGVQTRPFFWPLHLQDALPKKYKNKTDDLNITEKLGQNGLYIPMGRHLGKSHQKMIVEKIHKFLLDYK